MSTSQVDFHRHIGHARSGVNSDILTKIPAGYMYDLMKKTRGNYLQRQTAQRVKRRKHNALVLKAIEIVGSQNKLAKAMDVSVAHISRLLSMERRMTPEIGKKMSEAVGGRITTQQFCPEFFKGLDLRVKRAS
jgi:DNA-binding transcriptional regulator YdaS (Cro superfamily)